MWIIFRPTPRAGLCYVEAERETVSDAIKHADYIFRRGETAGIDDTAEIALTEPSGTVLAFRAISGAWFRSR